MPFAGLSVRLLNVPGSRVSRRMATYRQQLRLAAFLAGTLVPVTGCSIASTTKRTLINEPLLVADEHYLEKEFHHLAKAAWREFEGGCRDGRNHSHAFKDGFIDGYVDQLDAGGTVDPPTQAPRKYWLAKHLNPRGNMATLDWFNGFRQGAEIAQASGLRRQYEVPLFVPDTKFTTDHHPKYSKPTSSAGTSPDDPNLPLLPTPRPSPPSAELPPPPATLPGGDR